MKESTLWRYLRDGLKPLHVSLQRHEDAMAIGIPDVSYGARNVNGWIELKYVKKWSRNGVKVPWRPGQRQWLIERGKAGGRCWMLLRVAKTNYLFPWKALPVEGHTVSKDDMKYFSVLSWETREDVWSELLEVLTK